MDYVIRRVRIVGRHEVSEGDLLIENGRIAATGKVGRAPGAKAISGAGLYALPGFVDIHVHGGTGLDLTCGRFDAKEKRFDASPSAYTEGFPRLMQHFARNGATRVMLATVAAPMKDLERALSHMADYIADPLNGRHGARLEGALIEGTFIQSPRRRARRTRKTSARPTAGSSSGSTAPRAATSRTSTSSPSSGSRRRNWRAAWPNSACSSAPGTGLRRRRGAAFRGERPSRGDPLPQRPHRQFLQTVPRRQRRRGRPPQPRDLRRTDLRRLHVAPAYVRDVIERRASAGSSS